MTTSHPTSQHMNRKSLIAYVAWLMIATACNASAAEKTYTEADDGIRPDMEQWQRLDQRLYASWASRDVHYVKTAVPQLHVKTDTIVYAWRSERVGVEAVLFSPAATGKLSLRTSAWVGADAVIPAGQCSARFLRYVLTDHTSHQPEALSGARCHRPG